MLGPTTCLWLVPTSQFPHPSGPVRRVSLGWISGFAYTPQSSLHGGSKEAAPNVREMLFGLHNMLLKSAWPRSLFKNGVIQVTPVPAEASRQGTNWPQHASCSVLYRKGVHLFGVKGVPPGNAGTSKKWLGIFIACGANARLGWTAPYLTKPNRIASPLFGSRG